MKKHHRYTIDSKDLNAKIANIVEETTILGPVTADKLAKLISVLVKNEVDHAVSYALELGMTPEDNPPEDELQSFEPTITHKDLVKVQASLDTYWASKPSVNRFNS